MICALSGGVDSTVAATLVHKVRTAALRLLCGCRWCARQALSAAAGPCWMEVTLLGWDCCCACTPVLACSGLKPLTT